MQLPTDFHIRFMKPALSIATLILICSCSTAGKREFRALDSNSDGTVTAAEFANHVTVESFNKLDANSDGKIALSEWGARETAKAAEPLFRTMDTNHDSFLEKNEFSASRKKRAHFEGIFHTLDRDGNGGVTWNEVTQR